MQNQSLDPNSSLVVNHNKGLQSVSSSSNTELSTTPSPPLCGELAIVPAHSELQVAQRSEAYSSRLCRTPYAALTISSVCPTCHRPLNESDISNIPSPTNERRFTPQYFRALLQNNTPQQLTICDSPSSSQQQKCLEEEIPVSLLKAQINSKNIDNEEDIADGVNDKTTLYSDSEIGVDKREIINNNNNNNTSSSSVNSGGGYYKLYFREIQKLGNGTYGGVYLCQHIMEGVALGYFALKKIPVGDNTDYLHKVLSEVRILEEVKRHPNVVEYNHSWVDIAQIADFGPPVRCLFILMEYATLGSLDSYLEQHGKALPTIAVWYFFLGALAGIAHLHQKNILHRDLKPQNLLLTGPREKPPRVLVSDFGTATLLGEISYERTGGTGTMEYMAPELFECAPGSNGTYIHPHTKATDVWSLGMILHYLACDGTLPSKLTNGEVVLNVEERAPYVRPPEMVELIRAMLHRSPEKRPTCKDLLKSTVVQTILRSFDKVSLSSDILPAGTTTNTNNNNSAVSSREQVEKNRLFRVQWVPEGTPTLRSLKGGTHVNNDEEAPQSPLVEVPLMLQYKTQEIKRVSSAGIYGSPKRRQPIMVEQGVQTDYVKIVYE